MESQPQNPEFRINPELSPMHAPELELAIPRMPASACYTR